MTNSLDAKTTLKCGGNMADPQDKPILIAGIEALKVAMGIVAKYIGEEPDDFEALELFRMSTEYQRKMKAFIRKVYG